MGTQLLFIRHGEAAGAHFPGGDADRPLTEAGQRQAEAVAATLARLNIKPLRVFASPLRRAQETAEALKEAGLIERVEVCEALLPEKGVGALVAFVATLGEGVFALVGHEPLLSATVETLCFGAPHGTLALGKGSLCVLEKDEGNWRLVALLPSRWLADQFS
ncbi:MAG: phosphohistidine phosphatase SixA [Thermoanaerobaculum sp.]